MRRPDRPDPLPALKRRVADEILTILDGWSQTYAASFLNSTQSRVSDLRTGKLERFSLDRLVQLLSNLGRDVEIVTRGVPRPGVPDPLAFEASLRNGRD